MAFISPIHPTWNRSSGHSPRLSKRWITASTSRRFPSMSLCLAASSPSLARRRSISVSAWVRTVNRDVFTPQMSTFPCMVFLLLFSSQGKYFQSCPKHTPRALSAGIVNYPQIFGRPKNPRLPFVSSFPIRTNFFTIEYRVFEPPFFRCPVLFPPAPETILPFSHPPELSL